MKKMPRGASPLDRCLIHDIDKKVDYNYYLYISLQGDYFIMREKADGTEIRYACDANKTYEQAWIDRVILDYFHINKL